MSAIPDLMAPTTGDRLRSLGGPAGVAGLGLAVAAMLHLRDPHLDGSWGPAGIGLCPFRAITGWWCPGCGGVRAISDLVRFDVVEAIGHNVLAVVLVVVLGLAWLAWIGRRWRGSPAPRMIVLPPRAGAAVLVGLAVFTVVRNLPAGAVLAP